LALDGWPGQIDAEGEYVCKEAVSMRRTLKFVTVVPAVLLTVAGALTLDACARRRPSASPLAPPTATTATAAPASPTTGPTPTGAPPSRRPTVAPTTPGPIRTTAPGVPAGLRGKDIEVIPTAQRIVALTFDAGANADAVPSILTTLRANGIHATFFLTGSFASDFPGAVRAITAAGHRIGNHTATHPHCPTLSDTSLRNQLSTAEAQTRAAGGGSTRPLFRFPYGDRTTLTISVVNAAGYVAIRWTVDSLGWQGLNGRTLAQATQFVTERVVAAARPGEIVLMHVGSNPDDHTTLDAAALPTVISRLRAAGYRFVTLDTLLG
jgi:peptidoglycan/xylan/chitin deacetylase (PgdA/CDA1 family)